MAFEHSPLVTYALENGMNPGATAMTEEINAQADRVNQVMSQLEDGSYQYPETFSPNFKRVAVAVAAGMITVGSFTGVYKLATYDAVRPATGPYCPAEAYGQTPPVTQAMDKSQAYQAYISGMTSRNAAANIIITC
jgi:hypothetical protein